MKIIKHGKNFDDGKPIKGKCDSCGCIVEATRKEITITHDQRDGGFASMKCPECSSHIYFTNNKKLLFG